MLADGVEVLFTNTDPTNSNDPANISETGLAFIDTNDDGVVTINEFNAAFAQDTDFDGLLDGEEVLSTNTNPNNPDTDGDNLTDGVEVLFTDTDPTEPNTVDNPDPYTLVVDGNSINVSGDADGDGLPDGEEIYYDDTNPLNPDTDGDGLVDGEEVLSTNTNPNNPDTDGDNQPTELKFLKSALIQISQIPMAMV